MAEELYCDTFSRWFRMNDGTALTVYVAHVNAWADEDGNAYDYCAEHVTVKREFPDGRVSTFSMNDVDDAHTDHRPFIGGAILDTMADAIEWETLRV